MESSVLGFLIKDLIMVALSIMVVRQMHPTGSVWLDTVIAISVYWTISGVGELILEDLGKHSLRLLLYTKIIPGTLAILLSGWPSMSLPYFVVAYLLVGILLWQMPM